MALALYSLLAPVRRGPHRCARWRRSSQLSRRSSTPTRSRAASRRSAPVWGIALLVALASRVRRSSWNDDPERDSAGGRWRGHRRLCRTRRGRVARACGNRRACAERAGESPETRGARVFEALAFTALLAALSFQSLADLRSYLDVTEATVTAQNEFGNLLGPTAKRANVRDLAHWGLSRLAVGRRPTISPSR